MLTPIPELALQLPTLKLYIEPSPNLLVRVTVAEICHELSENLNDMEIGDWERIAQLYQRMLEARDDVKNLEPSYRLGQASLFAGVS